MIQISQLCKTYKMGSNTVNALTNINLRINKAEFVSITGASGSGKTTLMNIIGCLDNASGGEYLLDGDNVFGLTEPKLAYIRNVKIGFIFQSFNLIPTLTAAENVELPLIYRKIPRRTRELRAAEALEIVGLSKRAGHKPFEMSGGQQQRVAIARAIAAKPPIILADEPCGNLDSKAGAQVMGILRDLNRLGKTIVLITHDDSAAKSTERIVKIHDGRIAAAE